MKSIQRSRTGHSGGSLPKCNQEEFEKSGTNGKCIEARELMIALPESFINYEHDYLLKKDGRRI